MIPGDSLGRCWAEVSEVNPTYVESFERALCAISVFDRDGNPHIAGSSFVIAHGDKYVVLVSAKHVLEGAASIQKPHPVYAASSPFRHINQTELDLAPSKLLFFRPGTAAAMLQAAYAAYNDTTDVAICVVTPQKGQKLPAMTSIPLDLQIPTVGAVVIMVSLGVLDSKETEPGIAGSRENQEIQISAGVSMRVGVVTAVYQDGNRQHRWPHFTTSIPAAPGMSGGFVYLPKDGQTIAACGIVSADFSTPEAHDDCLLCGESIIASAWPALGLPVPTGFFEDGKVSTQSLQELMMNGRVVPAIGGIERVSIQQQEDGRYSVVLASN